MPNWDCSDATVSLVISSKLCNANSCNFAFISYLIGRTSSENWFKKTFESSGAFYDFPGEEDNAARYDMNFPSPSPIWG